jgi:ABC-type bacteriocin/lantibiotic exporter with double-glycine peptidase domain
MTTDDSARLTRSRRLGYAARVGVAILCLGCASYTGTARAVDPYAAARQGKWWMVPSFPRVMQDQRNDCGAAALAAVMRFWGHPDTPELIEQELGRSDHRLRAGDIANYARTKGLHSYVFFGTMTDVAHELRRGRPVIVGLGKSFAEKKALSHYEVVVGYEPEKKLVLLLDPGRGWQVDTLRGFAEEWARTKGVTIVAFLSETNQKVSSRE